MPKGVSESSKLFVATKDAPQKITATNGFQIFFSDNSKYSFPINGNKYKQWVRIL